MSKPVNETPAGAQPCCAPETASQPDAARYQVKPREDGRGPYRWAHVVKTPKGLVMGTIYRQIGDALTADEAATLRGMCDRNGLDLRRVP